MAKNTETAVDVRELTATNEITFDEIKEAFKDIVEFEFNEAQETAEYYLSGNITDFDDIYKDEVEYQMERMDECRDIYDHFDVTESTDEEDADFWYACNGLNKYIIEHDVKSYKAFNERYSGIVDADVLQEISNFVKF